PELQSSSSKRAASDVTRSTLVLPPQNVSPQKKRRRSSTPSRVFPVEKSRSPVVGPKSNPTRRAPGVQDLDDETARLPYNIGAALLSFEPHTTAEFKDIPEIRHHYKDTVGVLMSLDEGKTFQPIAAGVASTAVMRKLAVRYLVSCGAPRLPKTVFLFLDGSQDLHQVKAELEDAEVGDGQESPRDADLGLFRLFHSRVQHFFGFEPAGGSFRSWTSALRLYNSEAKTSSSYLELAESFVRKGGKVDDDYPSGSIALVDDLFPTADKGLNFQRMHASVNDKGSWEVFSTSGSKTGRARVFICN
ncbi:unnamed protein product, partial [Amoebophrya sp. A120]